MRGAQRLNVSALNPTSPTVLELRCVFKLITKKEEEALLIFERKIFRRIYGPKNENGEWKSRTNRELEEISKG
jgi:hypothetical protein